MVSRKTRIIESGFDFPNLPFIEDGEVKISQTIAIMEYITSKHGTKEKLAQVPMYEFLYVFNSLYDFKQMVTMPCYRSKSLDDLKMLFSLEKHSGRQIKLLLKGFTKRVGVKKFIFGNLPNSLDFFFAEFLEMLLLIWKELGVTYDEDVVVFLEKYIKNILSIKEVKEYRESKKFIARPFNNSMAIWK